MVEKASGKVNRGFLVLAVVALVLGAGSLAAVGITAITPKAPAHAATTVDLQVAIVPDMKGEAWDAWVPNELVVHQGDTVRLTIVNADPMDHGLALDDFNVNETIPAGTENATGAVTPSMTVVTFVADQAGEFIFKCSSPCGDGHKYMIGTLVVLPD